MIAATEPRPTTSPTPIPAPYSQPGARYSVLQAAAGEPAPQIILRMAPEWRERALALCDKTTLKGTPHHHSWCERLQAETWLVPTRSRYGPDHTVRLDGRRGVMACDCDARSACCHIGAVLYWMIGYDDAYRAPTVEEVANDARWYGNWAWAAEQPLYR